MKEKIQKWLTDSTVTVDDGYGGVRTVIIAEPDDILELAQELEPIVNQEVEKRIAERMPSEMILEEAEIAAKETDYACFAVEPEGNEINFADAAAFYLEGWNACRSRLTCSEKPNNSQKTEGGAK